MGFMSLFTRNKSNVFKEQTLEERQPHSSLTLQLARPAAQELEKRFLEEMAEACYALPMAKAVSIGIVTHNLQIVHDPSGLILSRPDTPPNIRALVTSSPSITPADSTTSLDDGDHNFVLTLSDFDAIKYIGVGGYGKVFLVYDRYSHKHLGMKVVPKRKLRLPKWVKLFEEQRIMRLLEDCPWAVKLQGSFEDSLNFYMVMQYAAGGDLLQRLRRQRKFKPSAVRQIFAELVLAVEELHKRRIMHRDIKLENILLDKDGHALLADFGLSIGFDAETRIWNDVWRGYHVHAPPDPETVGREDRGRDLTAEMVGTVGYAAPELIDAKYTYHSYEVDIFSLGVCVYMLLVGAMPFGNEESMKFEDVAERTMHWAAAYSDDVDACTRDLFDRMLAKDPRQRITIADIKAHPYFDHIDWDRVARREKTEWHRELVFGENKPHAIRKRNVRLPGGEPLEPRDCFSWFRYTSPGLSVRSQPNDDVEVYEADPTRSPSASHSAPPTPQLVSDTSSENSKTTSVGSLAAGLLEKFKNWGRKSSLKGM